MPNYVDLHTHSTASDGLYSPSELLQRAHNAGLRVLALTDHDNTNGVEKAAQVAKTLNIEFIPAIEVNTDGSGSEVHMLGYYPEYQRPAFQAVLQILRDAREQRGQRMVELLNEQGIAIRWDRVRQLAQGSVGRPHIARALLEAGYVQSLSEAFDNFICSHCPAYVPRYKLTVEDAIRLITSANGLPVMAHPIEQLRSGKLPAWLPKLRDAGMVGLETYYGEYTPEIEHQLRTLADQHNLIPTGGSDFHGPGIHLTPLGGRHVPYEAVERLKAAAKERKGKVPAVFELPPPLEEK